MENSNEKKIAQEEKRVDVKDEMVLEMVQGGKIVQQADGSYYCTVCKKTFTKSHACRLLVT